MSNNVYRLEKRAPPSRDGHIFWIVVVLLVVSFLNVAVNLFHGAELWRLSTAVEALETTNPQSE